MVEIRKRECWRFMCNARRARGWYFCYTQLICAAAFRPLDSQHVDGEFFDHAEIHSCAVVTPPFTLSADRAHHDRRRGQLNMCCRRHSPCRAAWSSARSMVAAATPAQRIKNDFIELFNSWTHRR